MAGDVHTAAVCVILLIYATNLVNCQRCSYMTTIPRPDRPDDLPPLEIDAGASWSNQPFLPPPERDTDDLCWEQWDSSSRIQVIYMEEEIEDEIVIAELNYNGANAPLIHMMFGTTVMLGPEFKRSADGDNWKLVITNRQDYETPQMQQYRFQISTQGEAVSLRPIIFLHIVNIDDNPPIIHPNSINCEVPELPKIDEPTLTDCVYRVSDADGEISTRFMRFEIESARNDDEIFYIEQELFDNDMYNLNMHIGLYTSLDFLTNALHIFTVRAYDSLPNNNSLTIMVQVENVEHRTPRWIEIFAVQQFNEKTPQQFPMMAIDGDTGIGDPIFYRLIRDPEDTFFSLAETDGHNGTILLVDAIDRDYLEREIFQLTVVAYKIGANGQLYETPANIVIIVIDINDQKPLPIYDEYHISIMEETPQTLEFDKEFGFHDRDLGENAQYEVRLVSVHPPGVADAFIIAPTMGYQRQTFIMSTVNHTMLDFEDIPFQHIEITVEATDMNNTEFKGYAKVLIDLINWNDELPIFDEVSQTVTFDETVGAGFYVGKVRAYDRDIDDRVEHFIMGNAVNYLSIDIDTGDIYVSIDNAFEYNRQNEHFVQIRATDTLGEPFHTATSQLILQLNDINNTPPTLRLPRGTQQVKENVPEGFVITDAITATDPDTTAHLLFEIDWSTSYATKQGRETDPREFHNCVTIETVFPDEDRKGSAVGHLVVKEIRNNVTIDYEEFEVLYLTIRVKDLETVIGDDYDEQTYSLTIIDLNDNPPVWVEGSLEAEFRVRELSDSGIVIGTVQAIDIDGPLYNQVRYFIYPREDTPGGLVKIDFVTGQITVDQARAIDADVPPRENLYYTVMATDRCFDEPSACPPDPNFHETEGEITIYIIDTNNRVPQAETEKFNTTVYIYENATTGQNVEQLISSDLDRDVIYHTVRYQINYAVNPRLRDFFAVDLNTGQVYVHYTGNDVLDRDGDEPRHTIFFTLIDNFWSEGDGNRNQPEEDLSVLVVLLDVNDNAPQLPTPDELSWPISENTQEGVRLSPTIYAPDADEPDTPNSHVGYTILSLTITNRDIVIPDLFALTDMDNVTATLITTVDLKGYWGTYDIHIRAFDHGDPPQWEEEIYKIVIAPYNFHAPVFVFPTDGASIRLAKERAAVNQMLFAVNGDFLDRIEATDEDGLEAGTVTFRVSGDEEAEEYFTITHYGENLGTLVLKQLFEEDIREFQVTITATDGGTEPGPLSASSTLNIIFVPIQADPAFTVDNANVAFIEYVDGLSERFQLPLAEDPKNYRCEDDCHPIYYRIVDGNDDGHFAVEPTTNVIYLVSMLDRDVAEQYTIVVAANNSPSGPTSQGSTLTVTVVVREANPRPYFERSVYTAGISASDVVNRPILTVHAVHSEGDTVTYSIDQDSMRVDPSLETVRENAFILYATSGILILNFQPNAAMHGMFEFDVIATDPAGAIDKAEVKIYLISSLNRVTFTFRNTIGQIDGSSAFIAQTFTAGFEMTCHIDQIVPSTDSNGIALDYMTDVRAHFIRDDMPVNAEEIELLRSDPQLLRSIQLTLNTELLVLEDFVTDISPETGPDNKQITVYVLAALSALLAFMCIILLLTFIFRTKTLNRRLEALSTTKYGSKESGLNRIGLAAPGTNKHAVEGSNPIWNEAINAPTFDQISDISDDDSDLIGIENLPQFSSDYDPYASVGSSVLPTHGHNESLEEEQKQQIVNPIASHSNNFGFGNTSPFGQDFADRLKKM